MSSSVTACDTNLDSRFSSTPFLCSVAMKSVSGLDMRNCSSSSRPANTSASWGQNTARRQQQQHKALDSREPNSAYLVGDGDEPEQPSGLAREAALPTARGGEQHVGVLRVQKEKKKHTDQEQNGRT
ncbi:hypothetical protein FOCC_FOCC010862 [Frankliniella occidentalis]|nr:hypothetical protein FOCC_FOCC010862 [Frankliniella occidentalis]